MFPAEDAFALSLLFHLNSEPWTKIAGYSGQQAHGQFKTVPSSEPVVVLPKSPPSPLMELIVARHSCRNFAPGTIPLDQVAGMLEAGYGITGLREWPGGLLMFQRAVPSAGGLYPLELYVICIQVEGVKPGLHHLNARDHALEYVCGLPISELLQGLLQQSFTRDAAAFIFIAAVLPRTLKKYGPRGYRYLLLEAGHAAQNICLRATELGLATLCVGGFSDHKINSLLELDGREEVALYAIAVGHSTAEHPS